MNSAPTPPDHTTILAALPLRHRPTLYLEPTQDPSGDLTVLTILEEATDPEEEGGAAIIGLAIRSDDGWYLGCIGCRAEIQEADSGMCQPCRQDAAWQEQQRVAAEEDW